jgi:hypothetical protein
MEIVIVLRRAGNEQEWWGHGSNQQTATKACIIDSPALPKTVVCNKHGHTDENLKVIYHFADSWKTGTQLIH